MRMLLVSASLLVLPVAPRADGGAPPAQAERPAKAQAAKRSGAKEKGERKGEGAGKDAKEKDGAKGDAAPAQKPCEPVKPCPIDG